MRLDDKAIIVAGAGRDIGRHAAVLLAREGARVVVRDTGAARSGEVTQERPEHEVVPEIRAAEGTAFSMYESVTDCEGALAVQARCGDESQVGPPGGTPGKKKGL